MTVDIFRRRAAAPITDVRTVVLITVSLAALGAAAGVGSAAISSEYPEVAPSALALFGLSLAAGALPVLRFRFGPDRASLDLFEAILVPAVFALQAPVLIPLVAATVLAANLAGRNAPLKAIFNAVQWAAAAGAASLVYVSLDPSAVLTGRTLLALIAAVTVASAVNEASVGIVVRINGGRRQGGDARAPMDRLYERAVGWAFNATFGLLFVTAYSWNAFGLLLFVVPLLVLGTAYRQYAVAQAERVRFEGVRHALRALEGGPGMLPFLEQVRRSFAARRVDLIMRDGASLRRYRADVVDGSSEEEMPWSSDEGEVAILTSIERAGPVPRGVAEVDAIAAPLFDGAEQIGVIIVEDRAGLEGFDHAEVAVLEALAAEVSSRSVTSALAEAVMRERQRLREIVDRSPDAGFALDASGAIVVWNEGMEQLSGYARADVIGLALPPAMKLRDERDRVVPLGWWADEDVALPAELSLTTRDGEQRWLSAVYSRVPGDEGGPLLLMVVVRDITEPREATKIREAFAGTVAHELRTPLTPIRGWAETLAAHDSRLKRSERRDIARRIAEQAQHLELLITRLLDIARPDALAPAAARANVAAVVARVVHEHRLVSPGRTISVATEHEELMAHGDPLWIERIVSNLVGNALKYSPPVAPVDLDVESAGGGGVRVVVADRGPGIPREHWQRIFDLYARLDGPEQREGAGLGLYISRQLARALGAEISVEDRAGGGSRFILTLRPAGQGPDR